MPQNNDLAPVSPPLGIYAEQVHSTPVTMLLKEKALSLSGDTFNIKDSNSGADILHCSGKALSLHDRKKLTDPSGKVLFNIAKKLVSLHDTYVCENDVGEEILKVRNKFALGTKLEATFKHGATERLIQVKGDFWGGGAQVLDGQNVLASIHRGVINTGEIFADKQTYFVSVAPGVDVSLMAALCICFDEVKHD